jgi:hypothetical protein
VVDPGKDHVRFPVEQFIQCQLYTVHRGAVTAVLDETLFLMYLPDPNGELNGDRMRHAGLPFLGCDDENLPVGADHLDQGVESPRTNAVIIGNQEKSILFHVRFLRLPFTSQQR